MVDEQPHMVFSRIVLIVVVVLLAGAATLAETSSPPLASWRQYLQSQSVSPAVVPTKTPASTATPAPTATPVPTAAPAVVAPTPTAPAARTATTISFVHFRSGKSTNTPIIADLDGGTTVQLRDDADSIWQGVTYQGRDGYIYRAYLQY